MLARKPVFDYPGGVYHIINIISRGNNRSYILNTPERFFCDIQLIQEHGEIILPCSLPYIMTIIGHNI